MPSDAGLTSDDFRKLELEVAKILLASSLDFIRNATQLLQGLTSILLASYVALFVGVIKQHTGPLPWPDYVYLIPPLLFAVSLGSSLVSAVAHTGHRVAYGSLDSMLKGYDNAIRVRRGHLVAPSIFTTLGLVAFAIAASTWT